MSMGASFATVQVRPATSEDAPRLARLAVAVGGGWRETDFAASLAGTAQAWLVESAVVPAPPADPLLAAALRPALAAAAVVQPGPEDWDLLDLAVAPPFQRHGLARLLLDQVVGSARAAGARRLLLEVREGNARALAVYRANGFEALARRTGYYAATVHPGREDAIVMALPL